MPRIRPALVFSAGICLAALLLGSSQSLAQSSQGCQEDVSDDCGETVGPVTDETSSTTAQQTANVIRGQVGNAVRSRLLDLRTRQGMNSKQWIAGANAGAPFSDVGGWLNYAYRNTQASPTDQDSDTHLHSVSGGIDATFADRFIVGLSLSFSQGLSDVESRFANATNVSDIDQTTKTVSPYIGVILTDNLYIDAAIGVSAEETDNEITLVGGTPVALFNQDGRTRFGFIDLTYVHDLENVTVSATTGLFRSSTRFGDTTEHVNSVNLLGRTSDATVWNIGGQATLFYWDNVIPYAAVAYERSLTDREIGLDDGVAGASGTDLQTDDRENLRFTLGLDWTPNGMEEYVFSVEGDAVVGREDQQEFGALLNLRRVF